LLEILTPERIGSTMSKTTKKFAPEVRQRAIRMVLDPEGDYSSRWAAITSVAEKLGCSGHTLLEW
jgi:transposase-like protein